MIVQLTPRVTTFIRIEVSAEGYPELDRDITLPQSAPTRWAIDAYLLSIGSEPREKPEYDYESFDEHGGRPRVTDQRTGEWSDLSEVGHRVDARIHRAAAPLIGTPVVSVTLPAAGVPSPSSEHAVDGDWLTVDASFREDDVNRELLHRYGVVTPFFDEEDMQPTYPGIRRSSRAGTLLSALTPARRLALLDHIDAAGLRNERDLSAAEVEQAVTPLAGLVTLLGGGGIEQDPSTGWLPESAARQLQQSLGWGGTSNDGERPGRSITDLARRSKLIRRFRGRVLATASAKQLVTPGRRTLEALSGLIGASTRDRYGHLLPHREAEAGVALLAVADGSVAHLDELPDRVARVVQEFDGTNIMLRGYRFDDLIATRIPDVQGPDAEISRLVDELACLSARHRFGVITPAMREVARRAFM